jgi:DNA-directed RNA polymerase subunit L
MMQIKSKKFVDEKLLLSISNIDSTFYNLLQNSFSKSKEMSSIDYQDVKIA